jgi:hypothetical protein
MRLPRVQFTVRRIGFLVGAVLVISAFTDLALQERRIVRFNAAWSFDHQYRDCTSLALHFTEKSARERRAARFWPEDSPQRGMLLEAARQDEEAAMNYQRVAEGAQTFARELRQLARQPN